MLNYIFCLLCLAFMLSSCQDQPTPTMAPEYLYDAKDQQMISSSINENKGTISILYGNEQAIQVAKRNLPGARYTLVTWKQKPMLGWYGTNMNSEIYAVESLNIQSAKSDCINLQYQFKTGPSFVNSDGIPSKKERINFIITQPKAVRP